MVILFPLLFLFFSFGFLLTFYSRLLFPSEIEVDVAGGLREVWIWGMGYGVWGMGK